MVNKSKIHIRNVSRFLASIVLEICWLPSDSLGAFWDWNSRRCGLLFLLLMISCFACPNWILFFVQSPCRVFLELLIRWFWWGGLLLQIYSVATVGAMRRLHFIRSFVVAFCYCRLSHSFCPSLNGLILTTSPSSKGGGLGFPCCSTWLVELV